MATKLIHKNSKVQFKNATGAQLEFGELAINYHATGPYLQAKGEDGNLHSLGGVYISSSAPSNPLPGRWWFDDANSKLFLYDGSSWQTITGSGGGGSSTTVVGGDGIIVTTSGSTATVKVDLASAANGLVIDSGKLKASVATTSSLGTVKVGTGLAVSADGTLSATGGGGGGGEDNPTAGRALSYDTSTTPDTLNADIATASALGVVSVGSGIDVDAAGEISVDLSGVDVNADLGYTPAVDKGTVTNTAGDDATLPLADGTNAGLFTAGEKKQLADLVTEDPKKQDLGYTAATDKGTVTITDGTDATLPLADATNAGLFTAAEKTKLSGLNTNTQNDGRYLRIDSGAGAQEVASTNKVKFKGQAELEKGVVLTGGTAADIEKGVFSPTNNNSIGFALGKQEIATFASGASLTRAFTTAGVSQSIGNQIRTKVSGDGNWHGYRATPTMSDAGQKVNAYYAFYAEQPDQSNGAVVDKSAVGFFVRSDFQDLATNATDGYAAAFSTAMGHGGTKGRNYAFFSTGNAQSFIGGDVYIGGTYTRNTLELWKSTLSEEDLEKFEIGKLKIPADVKKPGNGKFARAWYLNHVDKETREKIEDGTMQYPEWLQPDKFKDSFTLGDNTSIELNNNGRIKCDMLDAKGDVASNRPSDFWNQNSSYIGFQSASQNIGSVTTAGAFATTVYNNGYRKRISSGETDADFAWQSFDADGKDGGSYINLNVDGTLSYHSQHHAKTGDPHSLRVRFTTGFGTDGSVAEDEIVSKLFSNVDVTAHQRTGDTYQNNRIVRIQPATNTKAPNIIGYEFNSTSNDSAVKNINAFKVHLASSYDGADVTQFTGYQVPDISDSAATVYGFYSNITKGSNSNWNLRIEGDAPSFFAGELIANSKLTVNGSAHIRKPADVWNDADFHGVEDYGGLCTSGGFAVSLTGNGYRNSTGTWTSLNKITGGGTQGATLINLSPTGVITFHTSDNYPTGSDKSPPARFTINESGGTLRNLYLQAEADDPNAYVSKTVADFDAEGNQVETTEQVYAGKTIDLLAVITSLQEKVEDLETRLTKANIPKE